MSTRGRPKGSTKTHETVTDHLRKEVKETVAMNKRIRSLCHTAADRVEKWLDTDKSGAVALQVLTELSKAIELSSKGLAGVGKLATPTTTSEESIDSILEDLIK